MSLGDCMSGLKLWSETVRSASCATATSSGTGSGAMVPRRLRRLGARRKTVTVARGVRNGMGRQKRPGGKVKGKAEEGQFLLVEPRADIYLNWASKDCTAPGRERETGGVIA